MLVYVWSHDLTVDVVAMVKTSQSMKFAVFLSSVDSNMVIMIISVSLIWYMFIGVDIQCNKLT